MTAETRIHADLRIEQRAGERGRKLVGYAAVFDVETDIAGVFREQVAPGAFRSTLAKDDIRALVDHDPGRVLGRNRSAHSGSRKTTPGCASRSIRRTLRRRAT
jgi:phage head maturation protease